MFLDGWVAPLLPPLIFWILLNGLDDLILNVLWLWTTLFFRAPAIPIFLPPERPLAIFVPLWREHRVIRHMVEHNVATQNFRSFHFFIGAYPNDAPTLAAVSELESRFPQVHLAQCPHPGPTSKADCLNWIYQRMLLYEEQHGLRFETIVTHDAEDSIHPDALSFIDFHTRVCGMVQIPVLALQTPWHELTHGIYCDEFAQFQFRDMPVRNRVGGFVPSTGVGTGFSREAIQAIAAAHGNRIFEPLCLTEDYENGFRVHRLGFRQLFIPLEKIHGAFAATREYFAQGYKEAVRQRTRWATGITLQSWEYHTASETLSQLWWFWRDRKTLVNNLIAPVMQLVAFWEIATFTLSKINGTPWTVQRVFPQHLSWLLGTLAVQYLAIRVASSGRVYGWKFALATPLRIMWGNWIDSVASACAMQRYLRSRLRRAPLTWLKTEHRYPNRAALTQVYKAVPKPDEGLVSVPVTRSLPAALVRQWKLLPFRVSAGHLHIAGVQAPTEEMHQVMAGMCSLEIRFHRISEQDYQEMSAKYLPPVTALAEAPEMTAVRAR